MIKQINVTDIEAFELNYNQGKSKEIQLCQFRFTRELIPSKMYRLCPAFMTTVAVSNSETVERLDIVTQIFSHQKAITWKMRNFSS